MNKGFEIQFRDKIARIAVGKLSSMSIFVQKVRGKFDLSVTGIKPDGEQLDCWIFADDLILGDEIIIERKEIKQSSEPIQTTYLVNGFRAVPEVWTDEQKNEWTQWKLKRFFELKKLLSEESLI
jgi:hypothetical protein